MANSNTMVMASIFILLLFFSLYSPPGGYSSTITLVNNCGNTLWPALSSTTPGSSSTTAFSALQPGYSRTLPMPLSWSGRVWARTFCSQHSMVGNFSSASNALGACGGSSNASGACGGSSTIECAAGDLNSPATVVEFEITMFDTGELDSYRVTFLYGYNVAVKVEPHQGGGFKCTSVDCAVNLNTACPAELKVTSGGGEVVGCNNGCRAFGWPQPHCWSNSSELVDSNCPYAYNDIKFYCPSTNYTITFESPSLIESGVTTAEDITQVLLKIGEWAAGIVLLLLGGFAIHKMGCCNNSCNTVVA